MTETEKAKGNGTDDSKMRKFELYIKASAIDKETKGSCPICQQFFMITCLLGENQDDVDFKVFTVQAECPPKNFAQCWSKKYPVVMVNSGKNKFGQDISGMMYDTFEELETFFEGINKECPELKRKNAPNIEAMGAVENVYKHFNHFIAGMPERGLLTQLDHLNQFLASQDCKFLVDNVLSFSDCHLLPRLQHMRVAGKYYRDFDIPRQFVHIWQYLDDAYDQYAFRSTIPSDQDIIVHYEKKVPSQYLRFTGKAKLAKATYTLEIPEDIRVIVRARREAAAPPQPASTQDDHTATIPPPFKPPSPQPPATDNHDHEQGPPDGLLQTILTDHAPPPSEDQKPQTEGEACHLPGQEPVVTELTLPPRQDDDETTPQEPTFEWTRGEVNGDGHPEKSGDDLATTNGTDVRDEVAKIVESVNEVSVTP